MRLSALFGITAILLSSAGAQPAPKLAVPLDAFVAAISTQAGRLRGAAAVPAVSCTPLTDDKRRKCSSGKTLPISINGDEKDGAVDVLELAFVGSGPPTDAARSSFLKACAAMLLTVDPSVNERSAEGHVNGLMRRMTARRKPGTPENEGRKAPGNVSFQMAITPWDTPFCQLVQM